MSMLHLLWIIPVSIYFGFGLFALFAFASEKNNERSPMPPSGKPPAEFTP